jgi:hypothetical protein
MIHRGSAKRFLNHRLPYRFQLEWPKLSRTNVCVEPLESPQSGLDAVLFTRGLAILQVVLRGMSPVRSHQFVDGQIDVRAVGRGQPAPVGLPFGREPIVLGFAGLGVPGTKVEVSAVECDDGLATWTMLSILGEFVAGKSRRGAPPDPKTVYTVFLGSSSRTVRRRRVR